MHARRLMLSAVAGAVATVAFAGLPAGAALAATGAAVPCSGPGGGGAGLIAAINAANTGGGGTIRLAAGCTYRLTAADNSGQLGPNGLPVITSAITIKGAGATIARRSAQPFRILEVDGPGGNLTLQNLKITGGDTPGPGGAMFNFAGRLTLDATLVTGNASEGGQMSAGGGIASGTLGNGPAGTLVLNASVVTRNSTSGDAGGILNHAGTAVLNSSQVTFNTAGNGGGIASGPGNGGDPTGSSLTLNASTVAHNSATEGGGMPAGAGIANGGLAVIRSSSITGNAAPGGIGAGIINHGTMTIAGSRITGNTAPNDKAGNPGIGGGIGNLPSMGGVPGTGVLTVRNSVISGNSASGFGGGVGNAPGAKATVIGSTVSGNSAATGGGLASQGRLVMKGSLVTRNTASAAGGIAKLGGTVVLRATTVTRNAPDNCEPAGTIPGCTG
jgi:hypothetical protein